MHPIYIGILFLLFLSCRQEDAVSSEVFRYNENNGIATLDPAYARELEIMWATNQLFDGLVELDNAMHVVPSIARSWEISEDGRTYTFHLRDSVFFHPSELFAQPASRVVTASDVVYSYRRILDPKVASPGQWIFAHVDTTRNGGFEAIGDSIVHIYLRDPFPPFLGILTTQYAAIVPKEVVEHYGADFRSHPIGTGPFQLAFWYENVSLVLHRHDRYWQTDSAGQHLPYLSAVQIDFVRDVAVEFQGLIQGTYDFMSGIHPAFKDELLTPDGQLASAYSGIVRLQKTPFIKTDYIGFLLDPSSPVTHDSPLLDKRVRKALLHAINKEEMIEYLRNNSVYPANEGFVPPSLLHASSGAATYDPDLARRLLAEAGFPNGNGMPPVKVSVTPDHADLIEFIQHQWQQVGVTTEIQLMQNAAFRDATANGRAAVFKKSWLADYADPENFLMMFCSFNFAPDGPNYTHFSDAGFDGLYQQALTANDPEQRTRLYHQMNERVMEELPVLPLFYDQVTHFVRHDVTGLPTNGVNMLDLRAVRKEKR